MKILQIDVNYKFSSTGKIVENLHKYYLSKGYESKVFFGRGKKVMEDNVFKFSITLETLFHAIMTRLSGLDSFFSLFSTLKLLMKIKEYNPDIIHLHDLHGYYLNAGLLIRYLKNNNIKTIWTVHSEYLFTSKFEQCLNSPLNIDCKSKKALKKIYPK